MAIAPTLGSLIHDHTKDKMNGYYWQSFFWVCLCVLGLGLNIWLYFEDIRNNDRILDKVHKSGDEIQELMTSPPRQRRQEIQKSMSIDENAKQYLLNPNVRNALKRSMAKTKK